MSTTSSSLDLHTTGDGVCHGRDTTWFCPLNLSTHYHLSTTTSPYTDPEQSHRRLSRYGSCGLLHPWHPDLPPAPPSAFDSSSTYRLDSAVPEQRLHYGSTPTPPSPTLPSFPSFTTRTSLPTSVSQFLLMPHLRPILAENTPCVLTHFLST